MQVYYKHGLAIEEATLDAPIVIFAMANMVKDLREVGIDVIFHFPAQAMLTRFIKQRQGCYNEVPKVIRNLPKFVDLWDGCFNVFDKLNKNNVQLQFTALVNNVDGMQIPHKVGMRHGPFVRGNSSQECKFNAYIGNIRSDALTMIVLAMTGNHMFPIRYLIKFLRT